MSVGSSVLCCILEEVEDLVVYDHKGIDRIQPNDLLGADSVQYHLHKPPIVVVDTILLAILQTHARAV